MAKRDPMPKKLLVLVIWLAAGVVLSVVQAARTGSASRWSTAVIGALLVLGVLKGSEGTRLWLRFGSIVSLVVGAAVAIAAIALGKSASVLLTLSVLALLVAPSGFMLWCLSQQDVQQWMMYRSLGMDDDE